MNRAAIWARVSTEEQKTSNQLRQLRQVAETRGLKVVQTYDMEASAWNGAHRERLNEALLAAHRGEYQVLIVWALDRLSREGIEATLKVLRQFRQRGVTIVSLQEPWLDGSQEMQELMTAFLAWAAEFESRRRSERMKASIAERRAEGRPIGRTRGSADKKPRKRSGYVARWERERAER